MLMTELSDSSSMTSDPETVRTLLLDETKINYFVNSGSVVPSG
jgi:hypothetical protein